jgi:Tol biopolymer transport system component
MSVDKNAKEANKESYDVVAVATHVAFVSFATNLAPGATNGLQQILVRKTATNVVQMVSMNSNGDQGNAYSHLPSISHDGQYVEFQSKTSNLVSGDTNNREDVFLHDRATKKTVRLSVNNNGVQGNNHSDCPSITPDGRYVVFQSKADNLVTGDTNIATDVFMTPNPLAKW